jgi:hypothetical protein
MATENRLWGAPRIHGELLKLGITVSERTVSRYLPDRLMAPLRLGLHSSRTTLATRRLPRRRRHRTRRAMTTSSTPVFCRFAPLCLHGTGGAPPISGPLSIGLLRSNARLLDGLSPGITFAKVHAHVPAPARTRRSRGPSQLAPRRTGGWSSRPETPKADEQSETIRSPGAWMTRTPRRWPR